MISIIMNWCVFGWKGQGRTEQIRNVSDYDDFYVAGKEETRQQVENAKYLVDKIKKYIVKSRN